MRDLLDAPPMLQRLLLKIQSYDFEIKYIPDKEATLADTINKADPHEKMEMKGLDFTIHELEPMHEIGANINGK